MAHAIELITMFAFMFIGGIWVGLEISRITIFRQLVGLIRRQSRSAAER